MKGSPLSRRGVTRVAPHVVDTIFLLTGFMLAVAIGQSPWSHAWLGAKIGGLIAYIALGMAAMSLRSRVGRTVAFALAILAFGWIVSVARLKTPLGLLQGLA